MLVTWLPCITLSVAGDETMSKVWTGLDRCKGRDQALTVRRAQAGYQVITGNGRKQGWTIAIEVVPCGDVVEVVPVVAPWAIV